MGKAASTSAERRILGKKSELTEGSRSIPAPLAQPPNPSCPKCGSTKTWKDGLRYNSTGITKPIQRFLCRQCGFRFSQSFTELKEKVNVGRQSREGFDSVKKFPKVGVGCGNGALEEFLNELPFQRSEDIASHNGTVVAKTINGFRDYNSLRRVCASEGEAKNLTTVEPQIKNAAGATPTTQADAKGAIISFAFWLKKNGYAETTIHTATNNLSILVRKGADLFEPERVKDIVALQSWTDATKLNVVSTYTLFLAFLGRTWQQPEYKPVSKLPFIPTESELDSLISGSGKKTSCFLQLLKETGARSGEIDKLEWIDVDFEHQTVRITPEKGSLPRIFKLSAKCVGMLNSLPRTSKKVFGDRSVNNQRTILERTRKVLARKLNNPRLLNIHLHTFRHWFGTMLYHKTKDVLYVKEKLGHRNINSTLIYIQLSEAIFQEENSSYCCKVAQTIEEAMRLCEEGWEEWSEFNGCKIYRKRK